LSEHKATCRAAELSDIFMEDALHICHKSQLKTEAVIDKILQHFAGTCVVGEKLKGIWHSDQAQGMGDLTIVGVCPLASPQEERHYVVRWDSLPSGGTPPTILPHSQLRERKELSRKAIKHFLRKVTKRKGYKGAPMMVKPVYCKQYNLSTELPVHAMPPREGKKTSQGL